MLIMVMAVLPVDADYGDDGTVLLSDDEGEGVFVSSANAVLQSMSMIPVVDIHDGVDAQVAEV